MELRWQPSLLAPGAGDAHRVELDATSWVDHVPGFVEAADGLFAELVARDDWHAYEQVLYGERVLSPRLVLPWRGERAVALPAEVEALRRGISARYGVELDQVGANLYRDGRDSVAWHGDRVLRGWDRALVATVSLGSARRFLLRPHPQRGARGRPSAALTVRPGDLVVMGGACQRDWQHSIPKVASAGARISLTFRHSSPLDEEPPPATP